MEYYLETIRLDPGAGAEPQVPGLLAGSTYLVVRELARTGFSTVYKAIELTTRQRVVLKFCPVASPRNGWSSQQAWQAVQREIAMLRRATHRQVPALLEVITHAEGVYLVLPFVRGPTLEALMQGRRLSLADQIRLIDELCAAVAHLHARGIVHADLKERNIIVPPDGPVMLLDFGLARPALAPPPVDALGGTPGYMPPEQWGGKPLDQRADIYALGVLCRNMLGSAAESGTLYAVLAHMTAEERDDRYATVTIARRALHAALLANTAPAIPGLLGQSRAARRRRSALILAWNLCTVLVAVVLCGVLTLSIPRCMGLP